MSEISSMWLRVSLVNSLGLLHGMPVGGTRTWVLIMLRFVVFIFVKVLKHVSEREGECVLSLYSCN